jgi:hypothetical protein
LVINGPFKRKRADIWLAINGPFKRKRADIPSLTGRLKENGRIFGHKRAFYRKTGRYLVINGQFKRKRADIWL